MDLSRVTKWLRTDYVRRQGWMNENLTVRKALEMGSAGLHFLMKQEILGSYPLVLKIDISPLCHMACTMCVHATPRGGGDPLNDQELQGRMTLAQFQRIVDEVKGKTLAISMYYMGDPYAHSQVDDFCRVAFDAGLNVHLSTSFSFPFSDERIGRIAKSGVTHLTVCVDGATQEIYEVSRVGGRLDWVLSNLRRLAEHRNRAGLRYPKLEVQFISFPHNRHQSHAVREQTLALGADAFYSYEGYRDNWADRRVAEYVIAGPKSTRWIPRCYWPYVLMLIKYNGDVIPCCLHRFLVHNYHPARIFLGDSGSLFLGYVVAALSVWSVQRGSSNASALLPVLALAVPLLDTGLAVTRRLAAGRRVFQGDLDHIHHRMVAIGWSQGRAVLVLCGVTFVLNLLSVLLVVTSDWRAHAVVAGIGVALVTGLAVGLHRLRDAGGQLGERDSSARDSVPGCDVTQVDWESNPNA
jgi:Glycosyl transferase family 4/Radical SAM superfamily